MSSTTFTTSLEGKVAIVTGSSRSIGAAIVRSMAEQGAKVVVNYVNNAQPADELVAQIKTQGKGDAVAIKADAVFGKIDILVLNAGIMGSKPIADVDEAFFDDHVNCNIKGPLFMAKAVIEHLPTPGGRLIFFSSCLTAATAVPPNALTYAMSKGAIEQISRVLAKDLGGRGITVNTISPEDIAPMVTFIASPAALWVNGQNIRVNGGFVV
ncbi:hypothetical protein CPB85DRAFT_1377558 [Mucidula mucida]|nr:hypothetical protein CPB85DRAFT_1377558 [Mucidula mucida]